MRVSGTRLLSDRRHVITQKLCLVFFLKILAPALCQACPDPCQCNETAVRCENLGLFALPQAFPSDVKYIFVTGNNITDLTNESFPVILEQLTKLLLPGNNIQQIGREAFGNLPNINFLDLSNNTLRIFNTDVLFSKKLIPHPSSNRSVYSSPQIDGSNTWQVVAVQVSTLNLSNNNLFFLDMTLLSLASLRLLDLRSNALRVLHNSTLTAFSQPPDLQVLLAGNPWLCDCNIEDFLSWLRESDRVPDKFNLSCLSPMELQDVTLLQINRSELQCVFSSGRGSNVGFITSETHAGTTWRDITTASRPALIPGWPSSA
uniref:Trophoblast glycoprotein n=1 Tax=Paramormyrops kingsleyae TaxID=1676925 RepID=A0A3B3QLG8_9TELE|nr:trophoblast glycoprotein isoform X2 [Paramormyrops kingsleyae]